MKSITLNNIPLSEWYETVWALLHRGYIFHRTYRKTFLTAGPATGGSCFLAGGVAIHAKSGHPSTIRLETMYPNHWNLEIREVVSVFQYVNWWKDQLE